MGIKLLYITNKVEVAKIADSNGVDWVFVDLEIMGKEKRQGKMDTVISRHSIQDVGKIKQVLTHSQLLVRVNPIYSDSKNEIDKVVEGGADIIMLPFFTTKDEVTQFISYVNGRAKVCLLLETPEAVQKIDSILEVAGIDYAYIGLNDLHLGYKMKFMFEPLANGTVEMLCNKIKQKGIPYGFGGIARVNSGVLPAEYILAEHIRLGSSLVILSRTFCNTDTTDNLEEIGRIFSSGVQGLRACEIELKGKLDSFFKNNQANVQRIVADIVKAKSENGII